MIGKLLRAALFIFLVGGAAGSVNAQTVALTGGTVYASPESAPLADAIVGMSHRVVTAIWNSHVHFTQAVWDNAANAPAASLQQSMRNMLTQWGFTTVWDLGSDHEDSLRLRRRVNSGEVAAPKILLAGNFSPKGGHPVCLPASIQLPEIGTPDEGTRAATEDLRIGMDGIKLFVGASMGEK